MKKGKLLSKILAAVFVISIVGTNVINTFAEEEPVNIWASKLTDFENYAVGSIGPFGTQNTPDGGVTDVYAHSGTKSFKVNAGKFFQFFDSNVIEAGKTYMVSAWISMPENNNNVDMKLRYNTSSGVKEAKLNTSWTAAPNFVQYYNIVTIPNDIIKYDDNINYTQFSVWTDKAIYFDDVQLIEIDPANPPEMRGPRNKIQNGDFSWSFAAWNLPKDTAYPTDPELRIVETGVAPNGKNAAKLGSNRGSSYWDTVTQGVRGIKEDTEYILSVDTKGPATILFKNVKWIKVDDQVQSDGNFGEKELQIHSADQWGNHKIHVMFNDNNAGAALTETDFRMYAKAQGNTAWFANLALYEPGYEPIELQPTAAPTSTATSTATPTSTVTPTGTATVTPTATATVLIASEDFDGAIANPLTNLLEGWNGAVFDYATPGQGGTLRGAKLSGADWQSGAVKLSGSLVAGTRYEVTFWTKGAFYLAKLQYFNGSDNVTIGNELVEASFPVLNDWTQKTFYVTPTANVSALKFVIQRTGSDVYIDSVTVKVAQSEPPTATPTSTATSTATSTGTSTSTATPTSTVTGTPTTSTPTPTLTTAPTSTSTTIDVNVTGYVPASKVNVAKVKGTVKTAAKVTVYKKASTKKGKLGTVAKGKSITVKKVNGLYAYVKYGEKYGYVKVSGLKFSGKQNGKIAAKTYAYEKASTKSKKLKSFGKNASVTLNSIYKDYYKVTVKVKKVIKISV